MPRRFSYFFVVLAAFLHLDEFLIESIALHCSANRSNITLNIAYSNHSAWATSQNCSLLSCTGLSPSVNSTCSPSTISCFVYRSANNTSYCAPAAACSVMEPCDVNGQCSKVTSICAINTCCIPSASCLPLAWTHLCESILSTTNTSTTPVTGNSSVWLLDGDFSDSYGKLNGTGVNNVNFVSPGISGHGFALNTNQNTNQYMKIFYYHNLSYTSFTVQMWFYATYLSTPDNGLFSQTESRSLFRVLHYLIRGSHLHMGFYGNDTSGQTNLNVNTWYHAAFVYNYSALEQKVYLNGIEDGQNSPVGPYLGSSGTLNIGMTNDRGFESVFTGYIDQVSLVMRAKTATEILEEATLITWHSFDQIPYRDSGPNDINSTSFQVTPGPGRVGQALYFASSSSYYQMNRLVLLGFNNQAYSFSLWIKPISTNGATLIRLHAFNPNWWCLDLMGLSTNGRIVAATWSSSRQEIIGPTIPSTIWTHAVSTYSLNNGLRLYVNGTLVASQGSIYFGSPGQANTLTLGYPATSNYCSHNTIVPTTYHGYIDEFRVYSRELNATEISLLADS